jgi:hypothetical protein
LPKLLRLLLSVFAVLSLGVALAACGDDDDGDTDDTTTTEASDEPTDEGEDEGTDEGEEAAGPLCGDGATFLFPPEPEPSDDAQAVTIGVVEAQEGGQTVYSFTENAANIPGVGSYAVTFQNDGAEAHELIVSRINDDETRTIEELLQALAAGEEGQTFSTLVGATSACPGESTTVGMDIESAGRYVLSCNFPVGSVPGLSMEDFGALAETAPPHAAQGMVVEAVVS